MDSSTFDMSKYQNIEISQLRPLVGFGVMVMKDGKVLLGKRKGSHGEGEYGLIGGHLEYMESFTQAVKREAREEAAIEVGNIRFVCLVNLTKYAPKHYVDIGFIADWRHGEPKVREPYKVTVWEWHDVEKLPQPLFATTPQYLDSLKTRKVFYDA